MKKVLQITLIIIIFVLIGFCFWISPFKAKMNQKLSAVKHKLPIEFTSETGIEFQLIPRGTLSTLDCYNKPIKTRITSPFYCGTYEVTQAQWESIMGNNPSQHKGEKLAPVDSVSWYECEKFVNKLCKLENVTPGTYRLLTEAEWEYACRANSTLKPNLKKVCWFEENSENRTHQVGQKKPNAWGLYDTFGNISEWCNDWYGGAASESPRANKNEPEHGMHKVYRGGDWSSDEGGCSLDDRSGSRPKNKGYYLGLRLYKSAFAVEDNRVLSVSTK